VALDVDLGYGMRMTVGLGGFSLYIYALQVVDHPAPGVITEEE